MNTLRPLLLALAFALASLASAAGTPADTEITNQASATYNDSSGEAQATTSNQVVTIIQQVHAFAITPDGATVSAPGQTKIVLSGATAYFNYVITNTGNGTDTLAIATAQDATDSFDFASASAYLDGNCNGTIDTGEPVVTSVTLEADLAACLILAAATPSGLVDGAMANVDLEGTFTGGSDAGNWARAAITDAATLDASMSVTPNGLVNAGDTLRLTVGGSNVGASAAYGVDTTAFLGSGTGIVITSAVPTEVDFAGNVTGSAGAGTFTPIYFDGTWSTTAPADPSTVTRVGAVLSGSGGFFPQTASYTFSYDVTVDPLATAGTVITHDAAEVRYSTDGVDSETAASNSASVTVDRAYGVAVGPTGDPRATLAADTQTYAGPVYTGDVVRFAHTLQNTGNTGDSFTLAVTGAPATWVCSFRHADGTTPISAAVGPFPSTETFGFILACSIPQANSNATADATTLTVTATSAGDATLSDGTTDTVSEVLAGYDVDVRSNGATTVPSQTVRPGSTFVVPFEVTNTGNNSDVYGLTSTLPAGWTAVIYDDTDCDDTPGTTVMTRTDRLAPVAASCFAASIAVPADAAPSIDNVVTVAATSTTDGTVTGSVSGISFAVDTVASISLDPERSGTVTTPGTITYTLQLRNSGNTGASVDVPAVTSANGWTYQLSTDGSTWSPSLSTVALPASGSTPVHVRVIVPAGQPVGRVETTVFTATGTFTRPDGSTTTSSDTAAVTSTVVGGDLTLDKSARTCSDAACTTVSNANGDTAEPGDYIEYTVVAKNIGTADITEVIVMDPLPSYTDFVSAAGTTTATYSNGSGATVLFSTDGSTWSSDPATLTLAAGDALFVGIDSELDGADSVGATDTFGPGETLTITLTVQVR